MVHKWEGKASCELPATTADRAWSLLSDFCGFNKLLPSIATCLRVDGIDGLPGCVRYCASDGREHWTKEELMEVDPIGRSHRYRVTENNMGFGEYFATLGVVPIDEGKGCMIEWSFVSDPVEGWSKEGLLAYMRDGVEVMAKRIEAALKVDV